MGGGRAPKGTGSTAATEAETLHSRRSASRICTARAALREARGAGYLESLVGTIGLDPAFSISDTAGNAQTTAGGTDRTVTFDSVAPTLTLEQATGQTDPTKTSSIQFTLTASESLDATTVTAADFTVTNGTGLTVGGSGTTFTITVTASAQGAVTIAPSGTFSVSDPAGNATTTDRKSTRLNSSHRT